jgi:hypothetical protein
MCQVFHSFRSAVHRQQAQPTQQSVPSGAEGIAAGKRVQLAFEQSGKNNAIQKRVGMIGRKKYRPFYVQVFRFVDHNAAAENTQGKTSIGFQKEKKHRNKLREFDQWLTPEGNKVLIANDNGKYQQKEKQAANGGRQLHRAKVPGKK